MTALRSVEELLQAYPQGAAETANAGMPYADFGKEAAYTLALGKKKEVRDRCLACGLRPEAWPELAVAHHDFVSAQAHWEATRAQAKPDEADKLRVAELNALRREFVAQATFYLTSPADVQRLALIREGDARSDCIADVRALVQMLRPRRALVLDPEFQTEWLDNALALAQAAEKARAARSASAAVTHAHEQLRRVRDRTVARVEQLQREIRAYGQHAFRNDPKRCAAFGSAYLRKKRKERKKHRGGQGGGEEPLREGQRGNS